MQAAGRRAAGRSRAGSTYILILGVSVILMVIGLSAVTVARVNTRAVAGDNDWAESQVLAFSAAEHALAVIQSTDDWRTRIGTTERTVSLGAGTFRWRLADEVDGDLADNEADPFTIVARGSVNDGAYAVSLKCVIDSNPMEVLKTCLHADKDIDILSLRKLTVSGGAVSTNGTLKSDYKSVLIGDVEAKKVSQRGTISGTITAPAEPKEMPDKDVFDMYRDVATKLRIGYSLAREVLSPRRNPWGAPNSQGIYYIDAPGKYVLLWDVRINGTLLVRCRRLYIMKAALLHSYQPNLPALLVDGEAMIYMGSEGYSLREGGANPNYNPPDAPYEGLSDSDRKDSYPSEIRGLVHVTGDLYLGGTARIKGTVLCDGKVHCYGTNEITHDSAIYDNPPMGYTTGAGRIVPQSWTRTVD